MNSKDMTFLVVGCGSIGQRHLQNLSELGVNTLIGVEPNPDRRMTVAKELGILVEPDLDDGLTHDPDVAVICVPNHLHIDIALTAARAGCHLFVEKPLSHTTDGVKDLQEEIRSRNLKSMVACNMRFHPCIRKIKNLIEDNAIGDIGAIRAEAGQYLPEWQPEEDYRELYSAKTNRGGGAILDYIHELDYVHWIGGDVDLVSCIAMKTSHLDIETEDVAGILLQFTNDAIGEVHTDYIQRKYSRSCHIIGEEGTIRWDWESGEVNWYDATTDDQKQYTIPEEWTINRMYLEEMNHFLAVLANGVDSIKDISEAASVLNIALAAKSSARNECHVSPDNIT